MSTEDEPKYKVTADAAKELRDEAVEAAEAGQWTDEEHSAYLSGIIAALDFVLKARRPDLDTDDDW